MTGARRKKAEIRSETPAAKRDPAARDMGLERAALAVARRAHSPYSKIRVGAALRASDGRVYAGCNVENASYGLTLCAERVALTKAVSEGAKRFTALVIASNAPKALMPCGACRQVLHEFAPRLAITVVGPKGTRRSARLDELLPLAFGREALR